MENEEKEVKTKKTITFKTILISVLSFIVVFTIISVMISGEKKDSSDGASEGYVKQSTGEFILRYYPLLYPDTFKIKTINYSKTSYKDEGYELWCTEGYFISESKVGLEIKTNYKVYMQYKFSDDKCHLLWLKIDNETYYGSYDNVKTLR